MSKLTSFLAISVVAGALAACDSASDQKARSKGEDTTASRGATVTSRAKTPTGGARILFQSLSPGGGDDTLYTMEQNGADAARLPLDAPGSAISPDWSPDGKRITFSVEVADSQSIWIADADGGNAEEVFHCARGCLGADYPAWSPDGESIAFTYARAPASAAGPPSGTSIAVVKLRSRQVHFVVGSKLPTLVDLARWSPDGKRLVVQQDRIASDGTETGSRLVIVDVSDGDARPLTPFTRSAFHPDWNSTGNLITFDTYDLLAFGDSAPGGSNLFTIRPDGSGLRQLTHLKAGGNRVSAATFTPDGKQILFTYQVGTRRSAGVIASGGGAIETIEADFGGPVTHPRLSPGP